MKIKNNISKYISLLLVFVFFLGIIGPKSFAASTSLVDNVAKYGLLIDTRDNSFNINGRFKVYNTAYDAKNKIRDRGNNYTGKYYVYSSVKDSINISRVKNSAGSWVNLNEIKDKMGNVVYVNSNIKVYLSADNAVRNTRSTGTYKAGKYYVYRKVNGSINISTRENQPGSWINTKDLFNVANNTQTPPTTSQNTSGEVVKLTQSRNVYLTAYQSLQYTNSIGQYKPGTYYVYKTTDKSVNISPRKGSPGGWISKVSLEIGTKPLETNYEEVKLLRDIVVYKTADDAKNGRNPALTYKAGTYYIFRKTNDAVNISPRKGSPGGWVSNANLETGKKPVEIVYKEVKLARDVKVYKTANDSVNNRNPINTFKPGTYYIISETSTAVNISQVKGKEGGWISKTNLELGKKPVEVIGSDQVKILKDIKVFISADQALKGTNPIVSYKAGTYYIYREVKDAINISRVKGKPGGWVSKASLEGAKDPSQKLYMEVTLIKDTDIYGTSKNAIQATNKVKTLKAGKYYTGDIVDQVIEIFEAKGGVKYFISLEALKIGTGENKEPVTSSKFTVVLDAGHGFGDNRGGVIYDEGTQNFKFTEVLARELKKYKGVTVHLTRPTIYDDPSLELRATTFKYPDLFLSLHTNAGAPSVRGVEIYGSIRNRNFALGKDLGSKIASVLSTPNRGLRYRDYDTGRITHDINAVKKDYYGVLRPNTAKESFIIESVFHTNLADSKSYLANQENLARGIGEVIAKHYNLSK